MGNKDAVGNVTDIRGDVNLARRAICKGYTTEQVLVLFTQMASTFQLSAFDGCCLYKGLTIFAEDDKTFFLHGRSVESRTRFIKDSAGSRKPSLVELRIRRRLRQG